MLIQAIPIISSLIEVPQAVALCPAPVYQWMSVVGILIVRSFQAILLIGGNADIFNDLILFSQLPQKTLSRHRLEPCGTPPLPRARPSVAIQLCSVLPDDRRICTTSYRNIKHEFLIGMLGSDDGNFPTDVLFNLCDVIICFAAGP